MDRLSCGRGRTKRSGESVSKAGIGKSELSTGGGGEGVEGGIIRLRVCSQANDSSENCLLLSSSTSKIQL